MSMTVKELREALANLPDDYEVFVSSQCGGNVEGAESVTIEGLVGDPFVLIES